MISLVPELLYYFFFIFWTLFLFHTPCHAWSHAAHTVFSTFASVQVVVRKNRFLAAVSVPYWREQQVVSAWHHFHISRTEPYLPPKLCISIVFNFSWDGCNTLACENIRFCSLFAARDVSRGGTSSNTQDKWQTKVMQNFEGQIRCIIGNVEVAHKLAIGVNLVRREFRLFGERKRRVINT